MSNGYARFECTTCGELVYSPVSLEKNTETFPKEKSIELTCSGGHTDQYRRHEIELVETKPVGKLKVRYAKAVGG
jgi:hypothetical protein